MLVERTRDRAIADLQTGRPFETVVVTALARDKGVLLDILEDAKNAALAEEEGKTVVYTSYGPEWRPFGAPRRRRAIESVVLDDGLSDHLVKDVQAFLENGSWYHERGIPYRRGYLLYGPPGSGKTSFIQALAGHLDYNICVMNLSERGMTDDRLAHLLTNAPPRSLILLEDIDAAFTKRDLSAQEGFQSMVTFSGLLNALDGVAASEERLVFMTTNHISRLDPALIRPGRADVRIKIDNASESQTRAMFLRFYPGKTDLAEKFVEAVKPISGQERCSPASLQGHFVLYRDSPEEAVKHAKLLLVPPRVDQ
ncbi:P-loop containing nucleoside triphosphate hydrolase protein [Obelidium mucronatum]|nr:P-loop containing nucleoside triphosphate hydrolase protein [Obelidium mucronatum]